MKSMFSMHSNEKRYVHFFSRVIFLLLCVYFITIFLLLVSVRKQGNA